jgi:hypothetical protein
MAPTRSATGSRAFAHPGSTSSCKGRGATVDHSTGPDQAVVPSDEAASEALPFVRLRALPFVVVEIVKPFEYSAQPLRRSERSLVRPVINPLTHRHHACSASRSEYYDLGAPAHAVGLSFSVAPDVHPLPGSLEVTEQAVRALVARGAPLVPILRGRDARNLRPLLRDLPTIESAHPSSMSAHRGFFGSRPFSRAADLLVRQAAPPVDRRLP